MERSALAVPQRWISLRTRRVALKNCVSPDRPYADRMRKPKSFSAKAVLNAFAPGAWISVLLVLIACGRTNSHPLVEGLDTRLQSEEGDDNDSDEHHGCHDHHCHCRPGEHVCAGHCVQESPLTCGPSCLVCSTPPHATANCEHSRCDFTCNAGFYLCSSA